jgi:5-carboxymethyl-2-hydroxymuconate isomerase
MPHLRLYVPEEWLRDEFRRATGFDAGNLLDRLVRAVAGFRMDNPAAGERHEGVAETVPMINLSNLKHAIVPLQHAHVGGDASKRFLHVTLSAGNDTPGRTADVRRRVAEHLGNEIDEAVGDLPGLASVTVHVQDIDRDRGYSTTAERKKKKA